MNKTFFLLLIIVAIAGADVPGHWNRAFDRLTKNSPKEAVDWVNPFICTEGDNGQLYPGAVAPFGLVKLSPDTDGKGHSGYDFAEPYIHGFSHVRIGGTGCSGAGGNILLKPGIGQFVQDVNDYKERYDKSSEDASPGYYTVTFESGIRAELTATTRVGMHRYHFPKGHSPFVLLDLSQSFDKLLDAELHVENDREISGFVKADNVCAHPYYRLYFSIIFDQPFTAFKTWDDDSVSPLIRKQRGTHIGAFYRFPSQCNILKVKVGVSPVSIKHARYERDHEINNWNFDAVRQRTRSNWQKILSKIELPGADKEFKILFYTHLYHSYLVPVNVTASNGDYYGATCPDSLRNVSETAPDFQYYSSWSIWDDFRKYCLISLLTPHYSLNFARSIIDYYKTRPYYTPLAEGYWPAPSARQEFAGVIIMDAYRKGIKNMDLQAAFKGMKLDVDKFEERDVGTQLENAYQAYLVMRLAERLGYSEDAEKYRRKALSYRDIWCAQQKDDQGHLRGFFTPHGQPVESVDDFERYCYEGNLWHYRWFVLHDMQGLANLRGGRKKLANDLAYFFDNNQYMHLNEPGMHAPFLFDFLGVPWLTKKWARAFTTKTVTQLYHNHGLFKKPVMKRIYRNDPEGYIPTMDDDTGAMSSWFVMSAMGLFPGTPGEPYYLIGSPIFPQIIIHLINGKKFIIKAKNVSENNFYIQSATLNGIPFDQAWIEWKKIMKGGVLKFEMGAQPNKDWAAGPQSAPPSLSHSAN